VHWEPVISGSAKPFILTATVNRTIISRLNRLVTFRHSRAVATLFAPR
jgi:hypothetical protein